MKPLKMFGLAVLASLMAMAFVGVSSAMAGATAICKADEQECVPANQVLHVHLTTLSGAKAKLLDGGGTTLTECAVSFLGDALAGLRNAGVEYIIHGHFTYSNCTNSCSAAEVTGTDSLITLLRTAEDEGTVTGEGEVTVKCIFFTCTYDGEALLGVAKGPLKSAEANGEVKLEAAALNLVTGTLCPNASVLDITVTPSEKLWITK